MSLSRINRTAPLQLGRTRAHVSRALVPYADDLDEMLFGNGEAKSDTAAGGESTSAQSAQHTPRSVTRRRAWLWKNPLHNSFDDTDIAIADRHQVPGIVAPPSSVENSRRGSVASSQSSPNRSSPRKNRESRKKGDGQGKSRKDSIKEAKKEAAGESAGQSSSTHERSSAAQRLYRVLEEQALGEAVGKLSGSSTKSKNQQQPLNLCTPGDVSPNNRYSY